jgi:hypothetical protein
MKSGFTRLFRAAALLGVLGAPGEAAADGLTKQQCVTANESAPPLRQKGELRAARAQLLTSLSPTCPKLVRDDCADQLKELEPLIPTVVFRVSSAGGRDLSRVAVSIDGVPLVDSLDGSALAVDPGEHTFSFAAAGYKSGIARLSIRERAKDLREHVTLEPEMDGNTEERRLLGATLAATTDSRSRDERGPIGLSAADQQLAAYVVGGTGIAALLIGTYFGLHSKSTYDEAAKACPGGLSRCTQAGVDGVESAHTQAAVSTISFVLAGALLAGAVALFLTVPPSGGTSTRQQTHAGIW